jgi:hypothetical protein
MHCWESPALFRSYYLTLIPILLIISSFYEEFSMKTCTSIATVSWPAMSLVKAVRHGGYNPGRVLGLVPSEVGNGRQIKVNTDGPIVSR